MILPAPEQSARINIDKQLEQSNWVIQDYKKFNLDEHIGVAVREFPTNNGLADYMLFIDSVPVGIIEAKKEGKLLTSVHEQSLKYAHSENKWLNFNRIKFIYESTGKETRFTDYREPKPRSRDVFHFHNPITLREMFYDNASLRKRLQELPVLEKGNLRDCQFTAIKNLENSLAQNKPKALIQMATGSGKTFTSISSVYRLIKFAKVKRILFLVDTKNLGEQALQEFQAFTPPDDNRKFTELYNVQRLNSNFIDKDSQVCISTIQRMYSILKGEELDETFEQTSLNEIYFKDERPKFVSYNENIPIEFFDFIIVDECHRSIYNLWKQVLDYFDSFLIGLTATPDARTYSFFNQNIVSEYSHQDAVADGVNVGYEVYSIETEVTKKGAVIHKENIENGVTFKQFVETRSKLDRTKRLIELDDDIEYKPTQLDKDVVNPSQIRLVIRTFKEKLKTEIFPNRGEVPKTLIFAKTDSHADDIIKIILEEFDESNDFCKKITYNADNPSQLLQSFRNSYNPRIAVTVDMIATGTDVKAIECLLFMRDVRSRNYFEQMKGRGTRTLNKDDLRKVTPSAVSNKTHFVIVDAVGVCQSVKTESVSLERKKTESLKDLLTGVALGQRDEDTLTSLANRLSILQQQISENEKNEIKKITDEVPINQIIKNLLDAYNPDINKEIKTDDELIKLNEEEKKEYESKIQLSDSVKDACKPFSNPDLRDYLENCRHKYEQYIDNQNLDNIIYSGFDEQAKENAEKTIVTFKKYLEENKNDMLALQFFYQQPYQKRELTFQMIKEINKAIEKSPYLLNTDKLWYAYEKLHYDKVKGKSTKRMLTDIISLIRFEIGIDEVLQPYSDIVNKNFKEWMFKKNAGNIQFTKEQTEWLQMIRDHIVSSINIRKDDFDLTPFSEKGGLIRVSNLFGKELQSLLSELNTELAA